MMALSQSFAPASESLAWHYTSGQCAIQILQAGIILPAYENVPRGERPAVWFSRNKFWEPTASKGILDSVTRVRRFATMDEMERFAGGCYRFGIQSSRLLCWTALKVQTRMRPKTVRALERVAYEIGGNPHHWVGTMDAVPVHQVEVIQHLVNGCWEALPDLPLTEPHSVSEQGFNDHKRSTRVTTYGVAP